MFYAPFRFARDAARAACARLLSLPNVSAWCPLTLLDSSLLRNYYVVQRALDMAVADAPSGGEGEGEGEDEGRGTGGGSGEMELPGAIYLDGLDRGGLLRVGDEDPIATRDGLRPGASAEAFNRSTAGYAYVDTLLLYNVRVGCRRRRGAVDSAGALKGDVGRHRTGAIGGSGGACEELEQMLRSRRAAHPLRTWDDPSHGRLRDWP